MMPIMDWLEIKRVSAVARAMGGEGGVQAAIPADLRGPLADGSDWPDKRMADHQPIAGGFQLFLTFTGTGLIGLGVLLLVKLLTL